MMLVLDSIEQSSSVATACKSLRDILIELLAPTIISYDIYPIKLYGRLLMGDLVKCRINKAKGCLLQRRLISRKKKSSDLNLKKTVLVTSRSFSSS